MDYKPNQNLKITQWAEEDRPREKLLLKGVSNLTDAELIAILIGSGSSEMSAVDLGKHILASVDHNLHKLAKLGVTDLIKFKGIGEAKAISIVSALELGRRRKESDVPKKLRIDNSSHIYELMKPELLDQKVEEFWIVLLDRGNHVIKKVQISKGGINGTVADPKLIFGHALQHQASGLIAIHNHPSGTLRPSEADVRITKQLRDAGRVLEINFIDHLIFTDIGFYSFSDERNVL